MKKHYFYRKFNIHRKKFTYLFILYLFFASISSKAFSATCTVATSGAVFGNYMSNNTAPMDTAANIQVACNALVTENVNYSISLGAGNAFNYSSQAMSNGSSHLRYNLYTDSGRTVIWGDNTAGTNLVGDGYTIGIVLVVRNYPVYGRVPINQNVSAGVYSDSVNVAINY